MNMSQRISGALVHLPAPVTFILSQLALALVKFRAVTIGDNFSIFEPLPAENSE